MAATDFLLLLIPIGGLAAYMTNAGGFKTWVDSALVPQGVAAQPGPGAPAGPVDTNPFGTATDNKCFPAPAWPGQLYCQCKGTRTPFLMGKTRTCSNCEAECRSRTSAFARSYSTYPMKGLIVA